MPLIVYSPFWCVDVLSVGVVIIEEADMLDGKILLRLLGKKIFLMPLIYDVCFAICTSRGDSVVSLLILLL